MKLITYLTLTLAASLLIGLFTVNTTTVTAQLKSKLSTPFSPTPALADSPVNTTITTTQRTVAGHIMHLQQTTPVSCHEAHMLLEQEFSALTVAPTYDMSQNNKISQWVNALCADAL